MAEQWFLKVDGIEGESTSARHAKEIDIESWSFGATVPSGGSGGGGGGGGGGGSGRPTLDPFAFQAAMSVATPRLFKACVTGTHHKSAVLTGARGGGGIEFVTYTLDDVTVTSARHGDGDGGPPYDAFTLGFRKITIAYKPQRPTGGAGTPITVSSTVR